MENSEHLSKLLKNRKER